jgi:hypothetical protein
MIDSTLALWLLQQGQLTLKLGFDRTDDLFATEPLLNATDVVLG